ncbi:MAG: hypothetical protein KAR20_03070, partial [Candidatus Heimdallarchaeota archaeon]|nr:hypothetical protein [Candidatus Heimdallarchaeota archaeon]
MNKSGHVGIDHYEIIRLHNGTDARCDGEPWGYRKIAKELECSAQNVRRHCLAETRREKSNSNCGLIDNLKELENQEIVNLTSNELVDIFTFDENEYESIVEYLDEKYRETAKDVRISLIKAYMPTLRKNASNENFVAGYENVRQTVDGE